jgi:hypothetical protein
MRNAFLYVGGHAVSDGILSRRFVFGAQEKFERFFKALTVRVELVVFDIVVYQRDRRPSFCLICSLVKEEYPT